MAEGERRSLCVKVYDNAVDSRLAGLQEAFAEALDGFALARVARPASRDGSCTVGRQVLEPGADPREVRRQLLAIESRVLEVAGAVFRRVLIE